MYMYMYMYIHVQVVCCCVSAGTGTEWEWDAKKSPVEAVVESTRSNSCSQRRGLRGESKYFDVLSQLRCESRRFYPLRLWERKGVEKL